MLTANASRVPCPAAAGSVGHHQISHQSEQVISDNERENSAGPIIILVIFVAGLILVALADLFHVNVPTIMKMIVGFATLGLVVYLMHRTASRYALCSLSPLQACGLACGRLLTIGSNRKPRTPSYAVNPWSSAHPQSGWRRGTPS